MTALPAFERPQEIIARQLRQSILDGTYAPGERLPIERELSEQFAVSRSAIRQALLILSHQGLVKVRSGAGGGPFVARGSLPAAVTAFENLLVSDGGAVSEFIQAKTTIEPAILSLAATCISPEHLARLRDNVAASRAALRGGEDTTPLDMEFHGIIADSVGNRYLTVILELIGQTLDRLTDHPAGRPVDQELVLRDHERILDALSQHDAATVARLGTEHLQMIWGDHVAGGAVVAERERPVSRAATARTTSSTARTTSSRSTR